MSDIGKKNSPPNAPGVTIHDLDRYRIVKSLRSNGYDLIRDRKGSIAMILRLKRG
jgi:hypothetical protein